MKDIITDLDALAVAAEPLTFITDTGVDKTEGENIINELRERLLSDDSLLALAAPQIGINKRIFCIKFADEVKTFVNPIIVKKSGSVIAPETCASMPGKEILISRPTEITAVYYNDEFRYEDNKMLGGAARVFDQMAQLLDGILPSELGLVSDVAEDGSLADLSEEEIAELAEVYKKFVQTKTEAMQKALAENAEANAAYKKIKFTEDVINGRTLVVDNPEETDKSTPKLNRSQRRAIEHGKVKAAGGKKHARRKN